MERNNASFRDEGGFVFHHDGSVFRQIDGSFQPHYDLLLSSGLYEALTSRGLLIPHREEDSAGFPGLPESTYKVIRPENLRFITFPFEWSFGQMKDAGLATLEVQRLAIEHGMVLKDASSFNIQFIGGKPCLIDTLSLIALGDKITPWVAYRQFCEHFLVPLSLMSHGDARLVLLLRSFPDGVPIEIGSRLLPPRTYLSFGLLIHVHLHASFHRRYATGRKESGPGTKSLSKTSLLGLNQSLIHAVERLAPRKQPTQWEDYYRESTRPEYQRAKKEIVEEMISGMNLKLVWDVGANTGEYSRIFSDRKIEVVSLDLDPACVDENYRVAKETGDGYLHPLFLNIADPSPDLGWANEERLAFLKRSKPDLIVAFAIIHHVSISQNIGFDLVARLFSSTGRYLMIEFLEEDDPRVLELLRFKENTNHRYSRANFENSFSKYYRIVERHQTGQQSRIIYLMESQIRK